MFLAAASRLLGRLNRPSFFVRPDTLLGWHRQLVLRLARENPRWGHQRVVGELAGVGVRVSATCVAKILRQARVPPAGARVQLGWREFIRAHAASMIACHFFTVETLWLGRIYVLFFLERGTRRVHLAGCAANPDGGWAVQRARQFVWSLCERPTPARFLIHDLWVPKTRLRQFVSRFPLDR